MPFTVSHTVVALPFVRTPLVPAAIAAGAMTPDLPLFLRTLPLPLTYARTHSFAWLPLTIGIALLLLLVWRCILRPAARGLVPLWLARRLPEEWDRNALAALRETLALRGTARASAAGTLLMLISLVIGIVSHIVWDLFTHEARWGVDVFPALDEQWGPFTGYRWLQHGSTVIGLGILAVAAVVWLRRREPTDRVPRLVPDSVRWAWVISLPVILVIGWTIGYAAGGPFTADFTTRHLAYRALPPACAAWGALTILLALGMQIASAVTSSGRRGENAPHRTSD